MDAQNATGSDKTKHAASSPKRSAHEPDGDKSSSVRSPVNRRNPSPVKDAAHSIPSNSPHVSDHEATSAAPTLPASSAASASNASAGTAATADGNHSDAETIVLPGKDGHSPSKARKVKHETKSDDDRGAPRKRRESVPTTNHHRDSAQRASRPAAATSSELSASAQQARKKRLLDKQTSSKSKDGSSGLSSAPGSPPPASRRSAGAAPHTDTESDAPRRRSPKVVAKERAKTVDRVISGNKRKAPPKADSDSENEGRKIRRPRLSASEATDLHQKSSKGQRPASKAANDSNPNGGNARSVSPQHRLHRRSTSTQLPPLVANGLSHKKKRVPAPLQPSDYNSDDSSSSGGHPPRSSRLRSLVTPATADSTVSPAKQMAPHKKHLDAHGQTFLARACARGEYDVAKQRLEERPEDLNVADYAGNTPLQIAAINGCEDIVKLLIEAECNLDCVNYDKDTPLLDAVDNGHLGVVKLLLEAGVNPRKTNVNGEEPLDRVNDDFETSTDIRNALLEARQQRIGGRRRTSEDRPFHDDYSARESHGPESPRRSPQATTSAGHAAAAAAASSRRAGTVRSNKTSNHLLYMPMDDKTLRQAAGKGDEETVTRILQVRTYCDDPEAMVAAARGGHEIVMQLLLALGEANPDPPPVSGIPPELATPMLAAIGQENIKVVQLLLDQSNFDPTRKFKGETYFEIAKRRQGTNWKEEEQMLKAAYDEYRKTHKDSRKTKSPNHRERDKERERDRDQEREGKRLIRRESKESKESKEPRESKESKESKEDPAKSASKRSPPADVSDSKKKSAAKHVVSPKEKKRIVSAAPSNDHPPAKRVAPTKPRKELPNINASDRENSPAVSAKHANVRRAESDVAGGVSSEGETMKPRRKLISKGELRGERDKQRRASQVSSTSSIKDPSSPQDPRDEHAEKPRGEKLSEKYHDRTKALKRNDSKDRVAMLGDPAAKRHRSSLTPPNPTGEKDDSEVPSKKRRLDTDSKEKRQKPASSPERRLKSALSRESSTKPSKTARKEGEEGKKEVKVKKNPDDHRRESVKSTSSEKSIHVKSEDMDVEMQDAPSTPADDGEAHRAKKDQDEEKKRAAEEQAAVAAEKEEQIRREAEAEARREEEEKKRREDEERMKKKLEEEESRRKEQERRQKEEEERQRKEEEERQRKEEEERKRKEEEERKRKEEEEARRREEEQKRRREEEEAQRKRDEEERLRKEEEERLRKEQLEKAAEEARRKREEEERKERERLREEMERKRAAREAELRRIREEQERARLAKLPPLLRWLDTCPHPKNPSIADKFKHMQGVRFDTIKPEATGSPDGREQWILNTQVALLLGEKDLELSRYTAWERLPVSSLAKKVIWRLESDRYALTSEALFDLGLQLPDYYGPNVDPYNMSYRVVEKLRGEASERFFKMDMFFVKVSDLMYIVPNIPHLKGIKLAVEYRELPEDESQLIGWKPCQKWKRDPDADRFYGFAPRSRYYVNGVLIGEEKPGLSPTSRSPFPDKKVPRRGLLQVMPSDPDYARLCQEQGLDHLIGASRSPSLTNGLHSPRLVQVDGPSSSGLGIIQPTQTVNGVPTSNIHAAKDNMARPGPLLNGVNGMATVSSE